MSRQMKDSGIEWIGQIPAEWEVKRLKYLFDFGKGLPITKDNLVNEGTPVISYGQIHAKFNTRVSLDEKLFRYVKDSYIETNKNSLVKEGDIIVADTSEDLEGCGNSAYVDRNMTLFAGYHTIVLKSKNGSNNKYLAYQMNTDSWRNQIRCKVFGVKLFSITKKILNDVTYIVPSISEKEEIVEYLDEKCAYIDSVIDKTKESIEEYKKLKQSIITQAVTKGVRGDRPMKDSGIKWIGMIPAEWNVSLLKYSIEWKSKKGYSDAMVLSLYRDLGIIPKNSRDDNHNVTSLDKSGYKYVELGDLVINKMKAWQGSLAVSEYIGIVSPAYHVCRIVDKRIDGKYLHYLLRNHLYLPEYRRLSTGLRIGQWDLSFDDFKNLPFIIPDMEEQKAIVLYLDNKCSEIDQIVQKKEKLIDEITNYKKSIIYEYVTGKKEVPNS